MTMIGLHRRCGCDCRDDATFTPDDLVFNPLCCSVCAGDTKPPCAYVMNWECPIYCGTGRTLADSVGLPGEILRPICAYVNPCVFVSTLSARNILFDGCTWLERGFPSVDYDTLLASVRWSLDITLNRPTLTHADGYVYRAESAWDCFGPNTMRLVEDTQCDPTTGVGCFGASSGTTSCPALPKFVCITPDLTRVAPQAPCCSKCFQFTLDNDIPTEQLMKQRVQFLPVAAATQSLAGTLPPSVCTHRAPLISNGSLDGWGAVYLWIASPMDTGNNSQAIIEIDYYYGQTGYDVSGTLTNIVILKTALYQCTSLSCTTGGTFQKLSASFGFPDTLTVTAIDCIRSNTGTSGYCQNAGIDCTIVNLPSNQQSHYATEDDRCACADDWCDCMPGGIILYDDAGNTTPTVKAYSCYPPGYLDWSSFTGWCNVGGGSTGIPKGPVREATFGRLRVVIYCTGAWVAELYCDGVLKSTIGISIQSQCPLMGQGTIPPIPDCDIGGGCVTINMPPDCEPPPPVCCEDADETDCTLTLTSSCVALNGLAIAMTRTGSHTWSGLDVGTNYGATMSCGIFVPNEWNVIISKTFDCSVTLTSTNITCTPVMAGSFAAGVFATCAGFTCANGDTISAVVSP